MNTLLKYFVRTPKFVPATALVWAVSVAVSSAMAGPVVGTITVCYWSLECHYVTNIGLPDKPLDAPAFEITNTSASPIVDAKFTIKRHNNAQGVVQDTYSIGTIPAGASVVLVPQYSNDLGVHPDGSFWSYTGTPLDTSDLGPDRDQTRFVFKGRVHGTGPVTSGLIITGTTAGPSNDGIVSHINFLGGPSNVDGICPDCVGPYQIATIQ